MFILSLLQQQLSFTDLLIVLLTYVGGIIVSIGFHEFAHAYIANKCGDSTARIEGRMTLNPLAHLDPAGTFLLFLIGFGWGKPVPINPNNFKGKNDNLKVAFAGIITNLILAFVLSIPKYIALSHGLAIDSSIWLQILDFLITINIVLAIFNLLPLPPLDGSHLFEHFLDEDTYRTLQNIGPTILIGIIILGVVTGQSILWNYWIEPLSRSVTLIFSQIIQPVIHLF